MATSPRHEQLWRRASDVIRSSRGWSLQPLAVLGRPRDGRTSWLASGEPGFVVVKATANPFVAARAAWAEQALALLARRGYPVPRPLWHGQLDERWSVIVSERLPGHQPLGLGDSMLDALLALVERQTDASVGEGGWDSTEWIQLVLFGGWAGWCTRAAAAAPETSRRMRAYLEPARGFRLPAGDLVHGDLNLTNVLAKDGAITGVVDWDALAYGSRASDLAGLLFDWHRLRLAGRPVARDGDRRIAGRIVELAGENGLRSAVGYGAVARLALTAERGERDDLATWRRVTDAILDSLERRSRRP